MKSTIFAAAFSCFGAALAQTDTGLMPSLEHGSFAVDGRALSFFCAGSGEPTLVLEAPSGLSNQEAFSNVLPALAQNHRVCAYERAAYGGSPPLPDGMVQSLNDYARELDHFIARDTVPKPIVVIGYSYGGYVARYYTELDPENWTVS